MLRRDSAQVDDEAHTVNMILTCEKIPFPQRSSPLWSDFVRQALEKRPHLRPSASAMLQHPCAHLTISPQSLIYSAEMTWSNTLWI